MALASKIPDMEKSKSKHKMAECNIPKAMAVDSDLDSQILG